VEGGYQVHDYLDWQRSADVVKAKRADSEQRKSEGRAKGYSKVEQGPGGRYRGKPLETTSSGLSGKGVRPLEPLQVVPKGPSSGAKWSTGGAKSSGDTYTQTAPLDQPLDPPSTTQEAPLEATSSGDQAPLPKPNPKPITNSYSKLASSSNSHSTNGNHKEPTPCPGKWELTPKRVKLAMDNGFKGTLEDLQAETDKFLEHYATYKVKDWDAEWLKWVLRFRPHGASASRHDKRQHQGEAGAVAFAKRHGLVSQDAGYSQVDEGGHPCHWPDCEEMTRTNYCIEHGTLESHWAEPREPLPQQVGV
jgi:hypothetical protein